MRSHSHRPALRVLLLLVAFVIGSIAFALPSSAAARDTDGDGLPDSWEKKGKKAPGGLDIYKLGARYNHKDVFVELNYTAATHTKKVSCSGLDILYSAFAKAPVTNRDGKKGVRLHLDAGKTCKSRSYNLRGSGKISAAKAADYQPDRCIHPSSYGLSTLRKPVFRNGIVAEDGAVCGAAGIANQNDFVVRLRGGGSDWSLVTMHELGHIFGIDHGPARGFDVMSGGAVLFGTNGTTHVVDYRRYTIAEIDETKLDETRGYSTGSDAGDAYLSKFYAPQYCGGQVRLVGRATGPVDWDCSGAPFWQPPYASYISSEPVSADIDGDGAITELPALPAQWPTVLKQLGNGRVGEKG